MLTTYRKKDQEAAYESRLKGLVNDIKGNDNRIFVRAKIRDAWLNIPGTTVSGTVLSTTEFRGF